MSIATKRGDGGQTRACRRHPRFKIGSARTVFRENISERLLHNFIGGSMNECGILIDLSGGRIGQSNRSAEVTGLDDFKQ